MKLLLTFIFMVYLLKATASDEFFSFRAGEVKVTHPLLAKLIYDHLDVQEVEANLVHGLFFKNDRYLFCLKDQDLDLPYQCSIFLKLNEPWRLANYETDLDYGATELADAIYADTYLGLGDIELLQDEIKFNIKGAAALQIKDLIESSIAKEYKGNNRNQITCSGKAGSCSIKIPLYKSQKKDELLRF
jgi:hypothetical protein